MVISIEIGWNRFCSSKIESFAGAKSSNCVLDVPVGLEFPRPRVQTAMTQWFLIRSNQNEAELPSKTRVIWVLGITISIYCYICICMYGRSFVTWKLGNSSWTLKVTNYFGGGRKFRWVWTQKKFVDRVKFTTLFQLEFRGPLPSKNWWGSKRLLTMMKDGINK